MKKKLLNWNVRFFFIIYSFFLYRVGSFIGRDIGSHVYPEDLNIFWIPVILYLVLLIISQRLASKPQYADSYYAAAIAVLVPIGVYWGVLMNAHRHGTFIAEKPFDYIVQPAIICFFSILIAVNYFRCAAITKQEGRESWESKQSK